MIATEKTVKNGTKTNSKPAATLEARRVEIPVFTAAFTFRARPGIIPRFRGAVNEVVKELKPLFDRAGLDTDLFHNHKEDGSKYLRYPLIQYKYTSQKVQMLGLAKGAEVLRLLIMHFPEEFVMNNKKIKTGGIVTQNTMQILAIDDKMHEYRMYQWMALNKENFPKYKAYGHIDEKNKMLNQILCGNLERLCTEFGLDVNPGDFEAWLIDKHKSSWVKYVGKQVKVFDVTFKTNLILPLNIGIGKGVSRGFGKQQPLPNRKKH
jgi:CRISPR-associated endoribonuclease Cas6